MAAPSPPGPLYRRLGLDLFGEMRADLLAFSERMYRDYGDSVHYRVGPMHFYQFTHPDQIQEVLVKQAKRLRKPRRVKQILGRWDGQGLVLSEGDLWIRQRRLIQPAFHPRRMAGYAEPITRFTQSRLAAWQGQSEINVVQEMTGLTLDIVAETLFGAEVAGLAPQIEHAVAEMQRVAIQELSGVVIWPGWMPWPSRREYRRVTKFMLGLVDRIVSQRRSDPTDRGDLLSMLLLATDAEGDGRGMSDRQVRDEAMTLFLAGHETTAVSLMWIIYSLAANRDVQSQLAEQIAKVTAGQPLQAEQLPRVPLLEAVVKESMRLWPSVYFTSREVAEPVEIGGYRLPKGAQVHLLPYITHRDPRWFGAPGEFRPERFLNGVESRLPPCAYFPFGAGARACIGKGFAMLEAQLITAQIVERFQLELRPNQPPPQLEAQISLHPKGALPLRLVPRRELAAIGNASPAG